MTSPKLVSSPPEGSGLVPSLVDGHYEDLVRGRPGQNIVAAVILQPVGVSQRRTKDGIHRTVTYEAIRLEPIRDPHDADQVTWLLTRAHDLRHAGSQMALPVTSSPGEQRALLLDALREWAAGEDVTQDQLDERFVAHFGGAEHAATDQVQKGSLAQLLEFAGTVGAIDDPYADGDGAGRDDSGDGDDDGLDDDTAADSAARTRKPS